MKRISFIAVLLAALLPISFTSGIAAGKPSALPSPAGKSSQETKSNSDVKSNSEQKSSAASSSTSANSSSSTSANSSSKSNGASSDKATQNPKKDENSAGSNNAANASDRAKEKANENSAVAKSETGTESSTVVESGPSKRYIIRYADNSLLSTEVKSLTDKKIKVDKTFSKVFKGAVAHLTDKQVEALRKNPNLADIEPDATVTALDLQATTSWGLDRIDQKNLPLDNGFTYSSNGANSKIYVVDTGIRSTHVEFAGRVLTGFTSINDGQGTNDCNGHGTHVSGIAAGTTTGVAKGAQLIPVRVLDCAGSGSISGVIAGLDWIANNYVPGTPAVVNMSLGGGASSTLDSAVNNLISRGVTMVVAAGNSTADACLSSPSRVTQAITVAASTNTDGFASYSNYGSCVDLIAPGSAIYSSWNSGDSNYSTLSGTSMATPFVSGYVASVLSLGYQTASSISNLLKTNATSNVISNVVGSTANLLLYTSGSNSIPVIPTAKAPSAPSELLATAQKRAASLSWKSATDNGAPITSQVLRIFSGSKLVATKSVTATATTLTVSGLNSRTTYTFTVAAINTIGEGAQSLPSNSITPLK